MLDRRTGQIIADLTQQGFTLVAFRLVYDSVRPFSLMETTGWSVWARARRARRWVGVSSIMTGL